MSLTHIDSQGHASMVDVSEKPASVREARAFARVLMKPETLAQIKANSLIPIDLLFEADAGMTNLQLQLPTNVKEDLLAQIKEALTPGALGLQLQFHENNEQLILSANQKISCSLDLLTTLQLLDVQAKISF